jgi:hypothetical protein
MDEEGLDAAGELAEVEASSWASWLVGWQERRRRGQWKGRRRES